MLNQIDIPLSLYIHIPWCQKKCPYCDFNSYPIDHNIPEQTYLAALIEDLKQDYQLVSNRPIQTIFIGGGTPSLLSTITIDNLLNAISNYCHLADDAEITLEANPGTITKTKIAELYRLGINRLSIGVQSFANCNLQFLGRIHNSQQAQQIIITAKEIGFDNINIDLIYGLPKQNMTQALNDLTTAMQLPISHLSWYQLTIEPNTEFGRQELATRDDDTIWQLETEGRKLLQQNFFEQYEISAYALPDSQCQHNLNYWQFGDYLGIGAGAHGKITICEQQGVHRYCKQSLPDTYCQTDNKIAHSEHIPIEKLAVEFMLNALRLHQPTKLELFTQRTGLSATSINAQLTKAATLGLLNWQNGSIQPTARGYELLNDLIELFD